MSASMCIKCEKMVSMYEKYCEECLSRYGVRQDANWHKTHWFDNWDVERKAEFEKDLNLVQYFPIPAPPAVRAVRHINIMKRFWKWLKGLFVKPAPKRTVISVPYVPKPEPTMQFIKATKAYADQRQKMKKNRKRHPSKRMRHIYKTL